MLSVLTLLSGTPLEVFHVTPGRRYRFRVIQATGNHCPTELSIDGHELIVIASDGFPVEPFTVGTHGMTSAERYDFVLNADKNPGNYRIHVRGMSDPCDGIFGQGKTQTDKDTDTHPPTRRVCERQTDRQTDRQTYRQKYIQTYRQIDR